MSAVRENGERLICKYHCESLLVGYLIGIAGEGEVQSRVSLTSECSDSCCLQ